MTEAQNEEIVHALDAVYESINTGENIRAIRRAAEGAIGIRA